MEKTYQRLVVLFWTILIVLTSAKNSFALNLISDEETEKLIANISQPFFRQNHIPFNANNIFIVNDSSLNAFVGDGNNLFVHTGTIVSADDVNEIAGVLAHEVGHIQGGHILRLKLKNQAMQEIGLASAILAGAAAAATGRGDVAMAVMLGSQSSALTHYTKYRTEEERSADEAAMKNLEQTGQSMEGMLSFMKKISQQNTLNGREENPYFRTHPVTIERIAFFEEAIKKSPKNMKTDKNQEAFLRVKAKLVAFLEEPAKTFQKYPTSDKSVAAQYARVIANFKKIDLKNAQKDIDALIALEPKNPFFKELKAQIYMETGKVKLAKQEYRQALDLMPDSSLFKISLSQAILEDNPSKENLQQVVQLLKQTIIKRPTSFAWNLLARAYGELDDAANSNYAAAEYSFRIGKYEVAKKQVKIAQELAKNNQSLSLKIEDLSARLEEFKNPS